MAAGGKRQYLLKKIVEPRGFARKKHRPCLDACGLRVHPDHLVFLWQNWNRVDMLMLEILDQRHSGTHFFDEKGIATCVGSPSMVEFDDLAPEFGILKTVAKYIEHIDTFAADLNDEAY
jgi:hypothetical protein